MAVTIANTVTESTDTLQHQKAVQKILRQQELQGKFLRQASPHLRILEEQRRFQQLTMPYEPTLAQIIRAETNLAQDIRAQAIQPIDILEREKAWLKPPIDLHRLLAPIDPDLKYKAIQAFRLAELQYDPVQNLSLISGLACDHHRRPLQCAL